MATETKEFHVENKNVNKGIIMALGTKNKITVAIPKTPEITKACWYNYVLEEKTTTAALYDTVTIHIEAENIPRQVDELAVIIKKGEAKEECVEVKAERSGKSNIFEAQINIEPDTFLISESTEDSGSEESDKYYFDIILDTDDHYEEQTHPASDGDALEIVKTVISEGGWMYARDMGKDFSVNDPFKEKVENAAYGMKVNIRVKTENVPAGIKTMDVDIMETSTDDTEAIETVQLKRVKDEGNLSIFERESGANGVLISKVAYFNEKKYMNCANEFFFRAKLDINGNTVEKVLPASPDDYLRISASGDYNEQVIELAYLYEGQSKYFWDKSGTGDGVPESIYHMYGGKKHEIASMPKDRTSFCCGFTFWVALRVLQSNGLLKEKSPADVKAFKNNFFVSPKQLCAYAIPKLGVGTAIDFKDCQKGDFVQIWREGGSGHSVIFLKWVSNSKGEKTGFKYISTQPMKSQNGIGERTESFSTHGGRVLFNETCAARITGEQGEMPK
ncbi:MAG: hypothetical protein GY754_38440 [bacterium]|nr:hypothetical protein [bacterium]